MNVKKLAAVGAAAAMFLATTAPAFATGPRWFNFFHRSEDELSIKNENTDVDVDVEADSGDNTLRGRGTLRTGNAGVGEVWVATYANTTMVGGGLQ